VSTVRVADIAIDPRSGGMEALYTYRVEGSVELGDAFFVPLGTRSALGFVTSVYDATEEELGFPFSSLRPVGAKVDNLVLPRAIVDLAKFVAEEYLCTLPVALTAATPPGVRERLVTAWSLDGEVGSDAQPSLLDGKPASGPNEGPPTTPLQREVICSLEAAGGTILETPSKKLPASMQRALKLLRAKGLVRQSMRILPFAEKRKGESLLSLTPDADRIEAFLHKEGKKKPAQALTLMRLQTAEHPTLTAPEIKAMAGVTDTTIRALVESGLLVPTDADATIVSKPPQPNPYQQLAIDSITESVRECEFRGFLLYGVTGSGKTEVYLRAAAEALRRGRQVLYLVPEIALAAQAIAQLRERFGKSVTVLHSELAPSERLQNWLKVRSGEAPVVLGARSALFAPLGDVGLIVLDEEHEASYKQESAPRYHAKRLALFLGQQHNCPVVLGSATPSIESFYEAEQDKLIQLGLPERTASATLPVVHIHDLTEGYKTGRPAILTQDLYNRVAEKLEKKEQVILFLNRRAYAPFIICRDCGHQMICPHCAVSLSFHRRDRRLRCHHCGFNTRPMDTCPKCHGTRLSPFGVGTEKVEEATIVAFPDAKVARLDRDIARRKGVLESTLAGFRSGDIDILVGTQMVAKGLDFPNVTLVGVIAADVSLNIPDFRSSERTFQLLSQVAGRAGRGIAPGSVVVQTFNPQHTAVVTAQAHDYVAFYDALKLEREAACYPPFRRLVNVILSGESRTAVVDASAEAAARLEAVPDLEVLGPVDCALERVQNRWRRHLLIKTPPDSSAAPIGDALLGFQPKGVQIVIDVDPYSLM
jgi:primosomal protein N' (replication factor Y) (superfamily II helicase)